jgi:DNA-binding MarR family transcriptional regulator
LLSALLIAFTIEFDNEFEHEMPHRTTRHGRSSGPGPRPWLVSMAMWVHCMRLVPPAGISTGDLARASQLTPESTQAIVKRMSQWWGYLKVTPAPGDTRAKPPLSALLVRPTAAGIKAQDIWGPLTGIIEQRWDDRFGPGPISALRAALADVIGHIDIVLPDYLPLGEARAPRRDKGAPGDPDREVPLTALLSKVLLCLAYDFESRSDLSLGIYTSGGPARLEISANVLRVIGDDGVAVTQIPELSGVAKMATDNLVGSLEEHGYVTVGNQLTGRHLRVARLTEKGAKARDAYFLWAEEVESRWPGPRSASAVEALRTAAEHLVVEPSNTLLLWKGMEPYPDGWRSQVRPRKVLPQYPVVTHKGGFPDGS